VLRGLVVEEFERISHPCTFGASLNRKLHNLGFETERKKYYIDSNRTIGLEGILRGEEGN
jgi:hypothetical protein